MNKPDTDWRGTVKRRTLVAAVIFAAWAAGIEAKLVYLQIYRHPDLVARASKQQTHKIERKHITFRTRIKRLTRKTICFSRSILMHDLVIGLFINRYEFGYAV